MAKYINYKAVIQRDELMAMQPEAVAAFLKKRAAQSESDWIWDILDEEVEGALVARGDPLITLAVARYGRHLEVLKPLFASAPSGSGLRLSLLSNRVAGGELFSEYPAGLSKTKEDAATWLASAPDEELAAAFDNGHMSDSFLRDFLEAKKPWDGFEQDKRAQMVGYLYNNERLRRPYDDEFMDGYSDYSYHAVFDAAWRLAETVPATFRWAVALNHLYAQLLVSSGAISNPLEVARRWHPDRNDAEAVAKEAAQVQKGYLTPYQSVRKGMARLALAKDLKLLPMLLAHEDPAFRSATYSDAKLGSAELAAAYEKDGELLYNEAVRNDKIWMTAEGRNTLHDLGWQVARADNHHHLDAPNLYRAVRKDYAKKHPEWFGDDEVREVVEASDEPATKADIQALAEALGQPANAQSMSQVHKSLELMSKHIGFIWWFSLAALIAGIWRHW